MTPEAASLSEEGYGDRDVLIVDDNPIDLRLAGRIIENDLHWRVRYADSSAAALASLEQSSPDLIVTDLFMPGLDGLQLIETVRQRWPMIPIVLMTGQGNEELVMRALRHGAASYVSKTNLVRHFVDTLEQVASAGRLGQGRQRVLSCVTLLECSFVLNNDRALIVPLVELLQDKLSGMHLVDDCDRLRVGVALEEALNNALYHGNLGVDSALKVKDDGAFLRLAEERCRQLPYRERRIHVHARFTRSDALITIRDEGAGFCPSLVPDADDLDSLDRPWGRGLLLVRSFMDEVRHNDAGNEITLVKRRKTAAR